MSLYSLSPRWKRVRVRENLIFMLNIFNIIAKAGK